MILGRKQTGLLCAIGGIMAFSLAFAPALFAEAKVRTGTNPSSSHSQQHQEGGLGIGSNTFSPSERSDATDSTDATNSTHTPSVTITDEATGITVTGTIGNPLTDESIVSIKTGESALHAQGECEACDKARMMISEGCDMQLIKPRVSTAAEGEKIGIRVPIDPERISLTPKIYICEGGELTQIEPAMITSTDIRMAAKNQTPLAIAYEASADNAQTVGESDNEPNPANIVTVIPDDEPDGGDNDEEETFWDSMKQIVIILLAIVALLFTFVALDKKQSKK